MSSLDVLDPVLQNTHTYYGHDVEFIKLIHNWLVYHHIWAIPLILFILVVAICFVTMKFYLWWRFDRYEDKIQRAKRSKSNLRE